MPLTKPKAQKPKTKAKPKARATKKPAQKPKAKKPAVRRRRVGGAATSAATPSTPSTVPVTLDGITYTVPTPGNDPYPLGLNTASMHGSAASALPAITGSVMLPVAQAGGAIRRRKPAPGTRKAKKPAAKKPAKTGKKAKATKKRA